MDETEGFQCLGHSNWTICSPLSHFCSDNFQILSSLYWEAISYYPRGPKMGKRSFPMPEMDETVGFEYLGPSNWTTCNPLSHFCSENFQFISALYWEAIGPILNDFATSRFPSLVARTATCECRRVDVQRSHPIGPPITTSFEQYLIISTNKSIVSSMTWPISIQWH